MIGNTKNSKLPFFSVVIPVYNKEPHIARAISSVMSQTFQDFELIVICDPSTDNSNTEVAKFTDSRIRVFHRDEPGPGGYAARNLGIKEARAEWVAFLDADDEWFPEHLQSMYFLQKSYPQASVMGCGSKIFDPEKRSQYQNDTYFSKRFARGNHYLSFRDYLEAEVSGMRPLNGITACIKKSILEQAGAFPEGKANRGGDVDTWLRCIEKADGIAWSAHLGAIYFRDSVNMVTRTQASVAQVERQSVANLLGKYDAKTQKLLKKFANRRTISAWRHGYKVGYKSTLSLYRLIYLDAVDLKQAFWLIVFAMPDFLKTRIIARF